MGSQHLIFNHERYLKRKLMGQFKIFFMEDIEDKARILMILKKKERTTGFEPATPSLGSSYSTAELCPL